MASGCLVVLPYAGCLSSPSGWPWECGINNRLLGLNGFFFAAWDYLSDYSCIRRRCGSITMELLTSLSISLLALVACSKSSASLESSGDLAVWPKYSASLARSPMAYISFINLMSSGWDFVFDRYRYHYFCWCSSQPWRCSVLGEFCWRNRPTHS